MFGMSAERNEVERPARIDTGGTPALRSLCTRKKALLLAIVIYCIRTFRLPAPGVPPVKFYIYTKRLPAGRKRSVTTIPNSTFHIPHLAKLHLSISKDRE